MVRCVDEHLVQYGRYKHIFASLDRQKLSSITDYAEYVSTLNISPEEKVRLLSLKSKFNAMVDLYYTLHDIDSSCFKKKSFFEMFTPTDQKKESKCHLLRTTMLGISLTLEEQLNQLCKELNIENTLPSFIEQ